VKLVAAIALTFGVAGVGLRFKRGQGFGDEEYVYFRVEPRRWSIQLHWSGEPK
jgi:hypothetical protein